MTWRLASIGSTMLIAATSGPACSQGAGEPAEALGLNAAGSAQQNTGGAAAAAGGAVAGGGVGGRGGAAGGGVAGRGAGGGAVSMGGAVAGGGAAAGAGTISGGGAGSHEGSGGGQVGTVDGGALECATPEEETFSFFLTSQEALQRISKSVDGFGGNLAGLEGADAICQQVAESVSACQSHKIWHAFLSTDTEHAINRIGTGPWRDRLGRLFANNVSELLRDRPLNADATIKNDLPNEYGVPNHAPNGQLVDNHEILTGTGADGHVYTQTGTGVVGASTSCGKGETWSAAKATCWNWTSAAAQGCPRVGHSWPRSGSGTNWISVWNEGGCAPGGTLADTGGLNGTRTVGSAGGYGGFYCFAVMSSG